MATDKPSCEETTRKKLFPAPGKSPIYVLFAGVNGAGKTMLYRSGLWRADFMPRRMLRVNPDEILRSSGGSWRDAVQVMEAGKQAVRLIDNAIRDRKSFNQETTLSGRLALANIKRAKAVGYRIFLNYVGVADPALAMARIRDRVSAGGHGVEEDVVRRRFNRSLSNLSCAIEHCEEVRVFDNTRNMRLILGWRLNVLRWWGVRSREAGEKGGGGRKAEGGGEGSEGEWILRAMDDPHIWTR